MGSMATMNVATIPIPGVGADAGEWLDRDGIHVRAGIERTLDTATPPPAGLRRRGPGGSRSLAERRSAATAKRTRERLITAALACISIGTLFLFWYLGTKYRLEFYIRFNNIPTPAEVFQQADEVDRRTSSSSTSASACGAS